MEEAVQDNERNFFADKLRAGYAALREDADAWAEYESGAFEGASADGLPRD